MCLVTGTHNALWYMKKADFWLVRTRWDNQSKSILHFAAVRVSSFFDPSIIHDMRVRVGKECSSALKFSVRTTGTWFVMDFYKDKAKLIDKLLEEGPTSTEEEDEALVTLKRESHMRNKFFACHFVVFGTCASTGNVFVCACSLLWFSNHGIWSAVTERRFVYPYIGPFHLLSAPTLLKVVLYSEMPTSVL